MELPPRFTYPFRYTPHPLVKEASERLIAEIAASPELSALFGEGKMLGILLATAPDGGTVELRAFSGLAGGVSRVEGFVPPVFDFTDPRGHFRREEAAISELNLRIAALCDGAEEEGSVRRALMEERKRRSEALQEYLFRQYRVSNYLGEESSILEVFASRGLVPPGGTGDCAAPKLLQEAYRRGLKPRAMGEFWYGRPPVGEVREQGSFYPSCMGKCGPLLPYMMRGLDVDENPLSHKDESLPYRVLHEDGSIVVVDKPAGLICAPGKNGQTSLQELLCGSFGRVYLCHRLDQDTSGLMVFARSEAVQKAMQRLFSRRLVRKEYIARLVRRPENCPESGTISLPLMPDYYDRPRQMVDFDCGREALTDYELLEGTEVLFKPFTGRTHQLRVHAAHPLGLGAPIQGDKLYGGGEGNLKLKAFRLSFTHPVDGNELDFEIDKNFS